MSHNGVVFKFNKSDSIDTSQLLHHFHESHNATADVTVVVLCSPTSNNCRPLINATTRLVETRYSKEARIELINDSPFASTYTSAEWEGLYFSRAL